MTYLNKGLGLLLGLNYKLQLHDFRCPDNSTKPTLLATGGLTFGPSPFNVKITNRQ